MLSSASRASINLRFAKNNNLGDIQGKAVSQFTASTLVGVGLGLGLTKLLDITSLYQLIPAFFVMSSFQMWTTHISTTIVDEIYLNNQRANLLFNLYFNNHCEEFAECKYVNSIEKYYLPKLMNNQRSNYITFGKNSIGNILSESNN